MTIYWSIITFTIGSIFGSFYNVVGLRVPLRVDFIKNRSVCMHCKSELSWFELIPIFSYVLQKGKCRHCHTSISIIYPIIELCTGFLFLFAYINIGWNFELIVIMLLISLSIIVLVSDLRYMLIPNQILLFFLPLFLIARIIQPLDPWHDTIFGAIGALVIIGLIIIASQGGMGYGDLKLLMLLGFVLGFKKMIIAFMLAICFGAIVSAGLLLIKKVTRKTYIPFAPYITAGTLISYFYGTDIQLWYTGLFQMNLPL